MRRLIVLAALSLAACAPEPPPEATAEDKPVPENLHIVINPDGRVFWQGEEISAEEFHRRLDATAEQPEGPYRLAIHADGTYALDGVTLTLEQLDNALADLSKLDPAPKVLLSPEPPATYRDATAAITLLRRHGLGTAKVGVIAGPAN